jgi:hypothetical protein
MSLYAIQNEITDIVDAILDGGDAEAQQALELHLAGLDAALDEKADDYAALIQHLIARADARRVEAQRMRDLAATDEALADRLKARLKEAMETTGRTKLDTARFRLSVAGNGGKQPLSVTCDATTLPKELTTVTVAANKDAIRQALENGASIAGCELLPRGTSLRIR